jgi:hypothetical protein
VGVAFDFQRLDIGLGKFQLNHKPVFTQDDKTVDSRQVFNNYLTRF